MKITIDLDERIIARVRREAAVQGHTMSALIETALRLFLNRPAQRPLPTFRSGGAMVDIADRDALYRAMRG